MMKRYTPTLTLALMADTGEGHAPEATPATEAPAAEAPKVIEKPALLKQNWVTQPTAGSKTRRIWDIATEISQASGRAALRDEVMERGEAEGLSKGTIATQYGKWCQYYGVSVEQRKAVRAEMRPAPAPKAEPSAEPTAEPSAEPTAE